MPAATTAPRKICFQRGLSAKGVTNNGFSDVSLITGGVEAEGHGVFVDDKSIEQCMALLMGQTLPAYLTHDGLYQGDRLTDEIGMFSGSYREGLQIKAKQFSFLNAFKKNSAKEYEALVELADKMPEKFGLSLVFEGDAVWPCEDGSEVDGDMPRPEGCNAAMPSIRFTAIESCDFVKSPACNPNGVFTSIDLQPNNNMATETILLSKHNEALTAKDAELASFKAQQATALSQLKTEHETALAAKETAHVAALAAKDGELTALKASHATALAAKEAELAEAKKFDTRLAGGQGGINTATTNNAAGAEVLPEPAKNANDRWDQYDELNKRNPALAKEFSKKYLGR